MSVKDKRRAILEAARLLLVRGGYEDVALEGVAREAGVAKGTLFLYYKSKEQLIAAVFADMVGALGESLERLEGSPLAGRALLEETVRTVLEHFDRNRDFLNRCTAAPPAALRKALERNLKAVQALLERAAEGGLMSRARAAGAAPFLFGLCRSVLISQLLRGRKAPLAARAPKVADFFLHGARGPR